MGIPDRPKVFDDYGEEVTSYFSCNSLHINICPTVDYRWSITGWEWDKGPGNFYMSDFESCASVIGFTTGFGVVSARVSNVCGWSNPTMYVIRINDCDMMTANEEIKLYPNPASNSVTLSVDNQYAAKAANGVNGNTTASINDVRIYDQSGTTVFSGKYNSQSSVTINVAGIGKGVYTVEVNTGLNKVSKTLIIQR